MSDSSAAIDAHRHATCACHRSWPLLSPYPASWGAGQFRFKFADARQQRFTLLGQRGDRFHLRQDQTDQRFLVVRIKPIVSHPKLESAPDSPVKFPNNLAKIAVKKQA
jgi:hypothetical protein